MEEKLEEFSKLIITIKIYLNKIYFLIIVYNLLCLILIISNFGFRQINDPVLIGTTILFVIFGFLSVKWLYM